jgi:hypothetical protein
MWILWQYSRAGEKRPSAAVVVAVVVVDAVAVMVGAADVDAVSFRGHVRDLEHGMIAPVVAAVARHRRIRYL